MTRMLRLLFVLLPTVAFVSVAEAGPIVYFDTYRSLIVNGTILENTTTGSWSVEDPGPGFLRMQSSFIGQPVTAPEGFRFERIRAIANLNAGAFDDPENLSTSTDLFTSFALDVPHQVNLDFFVSTWNDGHAEGFFFNETTQTMLAQAMVDGRDARRVRYQGVLEPGVYSYYLFAEIIDTGRFPDSSADFGGDLDLIPPTPVPEPATMTLFGLGLAATAWRRRKRSIE